MISQVSYLGCDTARKCRDITVEFGYENTMVDWAGVKCMVESGMYTMFVEQQPNGLVRGFLVGKIRSNFAEVQALFVNKDFHRSGIGTALLNAYEEYCVNAGANKIRLVPRQTKQARAFYEKCGYVASDLGYCLQKTL